jgi:hypothetical protein
LVYSVVLTLFIMCSCLYSGEIRVVFLNRVVAIGRRDMTPGPNDDNWEGEATGFFYGVFDHKVGNTMTSYQPYLVTNRHVIEEHIASNSGPLSIRLNPKSGGLVREYDFPLVVNGKPT